MQLFFLRHADADPNEDGSISDEKRQLTEKGLKQARQLARMLKTWEVAPTRLYSSPLMRAKQTADIVAEAVKVSVAVRRELAPGFDAEAVNILTRDMHGDASVMFVGHEPDFSAIIGQLIGGGRVVMKKCGLARLDIIDTNPLRCELAWMIPPKVFMEME